MKLTLNPVPIRNPGTAVTSVSLENQRGASEYDVTITRAQTPHGPVRVLSASRLRINGEENVEVGLANAGEALEVSSRKAALRFDLTLSQITRRGTLHFVPRRSKPWSRLSLLTIVNDKHDRYATR